MTVSSITSNAPNLGEVVSAPVGDTVFTIDGSGDITRTSGNGVRVTSGSSQVKVTLKCGGQAACATADASVSIANAGTPTGPARAMTNFVVSGVTPVGGALTGNPVNFVLPPIGKNGSVTFDLGMDFGIQGASSGLSGSAVSNFIVMVGPYPAAPTASRTSTGGKATVLRPISIEKTADLSFGAIVRPKSGGAYISIDKTSGARATGNAIGLPSPAYNPAAFLISGEGAQQFTLTTDASLTMTARGGSTLVAQLLPSATGGGKTLSGSLGGAGTLALTVGAGMNISSTTPSGAYVGVFTVTVSYN